METMILFSIFIKIISLQIDHETISFHAQKYLTSINYQLEILQITLS